MNEIWWLLAGVAAGVLVMVPIGRLLLHRARQRAIVAEREARDAARLAELGAMTGGLAHEIKNPLSTIVLNADLLSEALAEADLPADQRERLARRLDSLRRETGRLRDILTDFLQFAGRIKLDTQRTDVARIADEICDFFLPQCEQAGVMLRSQLPERPVFVRADVGLFKQALLNLMINAVQAMSNGADRAAPPARIGELMIRVQPDRDEVAIHVIDTGPGIDPGRLEEIFRPYVSSRGKGTGLGLPIARRIVEEHGGRLTVDTEAGRGSDFVIHLPVSKD